MTSHRKYYIVHEKLYSLLFGVFYMSRFETGDKRSVIHRAMHYAIQDREAMIQALTPQHSEPTGKDAEYIKECEALIRDFKKILAAK